MRPETLIVVAALNEADRIAATVRALRRAFPDAPIWVADDGSRDATPELARAAGARVVRSEQKTSRGSWAGGKGRAMTLGVQAALRDVHLLDAPARAGACAGGGIVLGDTSSPSGPVAEPASAEPIVVLCDGDLGGSARELPALLGPIRRGDADLTVAAFSTRATGGFGVALAFARWAVRRRCDGLRLRAPISGQRALRAGVLREMLPFAAGYGMEVGMTIDAVRAGYRVLEIDLPLAHRPTGRTLAGFAHRGRQLADFVRVYLSRR